MAPATTQPARSTSARYRHTRSRQTSTDVPKRIRLLAGVNPGLVNASAISRMPRGDCAIDGRRVSEQIGRMRYGAPWACVLGLASSVLLSLGCSGSDSDDADGQGGSAGSAGGPGGQGSAGAPMTGPDLDSSLLIRELTREQKAVLCDWVYATHGGYGVSTRCSHGGSVRNLASQEQCLSLGFSYSCLSVTVGDLVRCTIAKTPSGGCVTPSPACDATQCIES